MEKKKLKKRKKIKNMDKKNLSTIIKLGPTHYKILLQMCFCSLCRIDAH